MDKKKEYLLKHFASTLRAMALGKAKETKIEPNVAVCLSRKDLIEIVKKQFGGSIPKEHNLIEMENLELLGLIENEMLVISYMTEKWSQEPKVVAKSSVQKMETPKKEQPKKAEASKK